MVLFLSGAPKTPPALGLTPVIPEEPDYSGYLYELEKINSQFNQELHRIKCRSRFLEI